MTVRRMLWCGVVLMATGTAGAQENARELSAWKMQDVAKLQDAAGGAALPERASVAGFATEGWYAATVPGTVLTTLVENKVYPEPLYGETMRDIPESLNQATYWYRTEFEVPAIERGRRTWVHFEGVNFSAEVWVNGRHVGGMRGAFVRGDFDLSDYVTAGKKAAMVVVVKPQPHPGVPHEHTVTLGEGRNGGETAIDGPTFLSTIGWDWLAAVRDRDTGIWLPVTLSWTGPVVVKDPQVTTSVDLEENSAELRVAGTVKNVSDERVSGTVTGTISGQGNPVVFRKAVTLGAGEISVVTFDSATTPWLHVREPKLWWPNGYGPQNLYKVRMEFVAGGRVSSGEERQFGIRKMEYQVADSENLTISVNGVKVMVRGGNWGLDEAMKRASRERLEAQFHLHALANLNMIRNWVGQSTSPMFYEMADKYGILLWDEFFQPNPSDGPNVTDVPTYIANVTDKVERYRNHPSIAVWCARNEGYPPRELDDQLRVLMGKLDPTRLYQPSSTDGRGVSSGGPYYWRAPRFFYQIKESFKTETGSVSVPTMESIQGMMPRKDWETINDDWAQHDMAKGAQRGDQYPEELAKRYGAVRNLADFVRKAQLANYEAFRAMYEGRNAEMFKSTSGVITWMSHPAQPSFVWQLYHYDLEPNASLYAVKSASETVHVQLNEANGGIEVVNNRPEELAGMVVKASVYRLDGGLDAATSYPLSTVAGSTTVTVAALELSAGISPVYFVKLDLLDKMGKVVSTNFYWQGVMRDDLSELVKMPVAKLDVKAKAEVVGAKTVVHVMLRNPAVPNPTTSVALMVHLQLHQKATGKRVLPVFYEDNYVSLAPGEAREVTIEAATKDVGRGGAEVLVDGFNVDVTAWEGAVPVRLNENAQPMRWPASGLVPVKP